MPTSVVTGGCGSVQAKVTALGVLHELKGCIGGARLSSDRESHAQKRQMAYSTDGRRSIAGHSAHRSQQALAEQKAVEQVVEVAQHLRVIGGTAETACRLCGDAELVRSTDLKRSRTLCNLSVRSSSIVFSRKRENLQDRLCLPCREVLGDRD
jgi:hypothetical protein